MVNCKQCGNQLAEESLYCNKCGTKTNFDPPKEDNGIDEKNIPIPTVNKKNSNEKVLYMWIIGVAVVVAAIIFIVIYNIPSNISKRVADDYLKAIHNGMPTYEYKYDTVLDYKNVLEYTYLSTAHEYSHNGKETITFDQDWYDRFEKDNFVSLNDFLDDEREFYKNFKDRTIIEDTEDKIVVRDNRKGNEVDLIYNLQVTNGLGQPVYRKVRISVDNFSGDYKISSISEE